MNYNYQKNISMFEAYEIPLNCVPSNGDAIDGYVVEKKLGEGAFGSVYKVRKQGELYALKLLHLYAIPYEEERKGIMKRFRMEYETGRIPSTYLVHTHDYGKISGNPYIVMDLCNGGDLRAKIGQSINIEQINKWAIQVLNGLKILHENGKVHRDLKPDNVLLTDYDVAKLTDFGIAGHKSLRMTKMNIFNKPTEIFGTLAYMAPEQINPTNKHVTVLPTIDIFAFGIMFYEIFSAHYPFGSLRTDADLAEYSKNVANGKITNISKYGIRLPAFWTQIFNGTLQPNYKNRIQNVNEILTLMGRPSENKKINFDFHKDQVYLQILQGEEYGKRISLSSLFIDEEGVITLGRKDYDHKNHIDISEKETCYISRKQATIEKINGINAGYYILDGQWDRELRKWKNSLNGTYVNSEQLTEGERIKLEPNCIITIGDVTMKLLTIK